MSGQQLPMTHFSFHGCSIGWRFFFRVCAVERVFQKRSMLVRCWTRARWAIARIWLDLGIAEIARFSFNQVLLQTSLLSLCVSLIAVPVFVCTITNKAKCNASTSIRIAFLLPCQAKRLLHSHGGALLSFRTPENGSNIMLESITECGCLLPY